MSIRGKAIHVKKSVWAMSKPGKRVSALPSSERTAFSSWGWFEFAEAAALKSKCVTGYLLGYYIKSCDFCPPCYKIVKKKHWNDP